MLFFAENIISVQVNVRRLKSILYSRCRRPILSYGCEIWSVAKTDKEKLLTFERKLLCLIYVWSYYEKWSIQNENQ